jgi:hypothetical protein
MRQFSRVLESDAPALAAARSATKNRRTSVPAILIGIVLLLGVSLALAFYFRRTTSSNSPLPIKSIAVLPFKPLVAAERDESTRVGNGRYSDYPAQPYRTTHCQAHKRREAVHPARR